MLPLIKSEMLLPKGNHHSYFNTVLLGIIWHSNHLYQYKKSKANNNISSVKIYRSWEIYCSYHVLYTVTVKQHGVYYM